MVKLYNHYDELNKDVLLKEDDFIEDASSFLIKREGYRPAQLKSRQAVYDAFMEHFRVQNVNEITALKDLTYAQEANKEDKEQLGRLMDTYDSMDSDFGFKAAQDYVGGVLTAPSTVAGLFTGGTTKLGAIAGNQATKLGIREIIKRSMANKGLQATIAMDALASGGTVAAQEQTRVETDIKDEIDMKNVGLAAALGGLSSGVVGGAVAYKRGINTQKSEQIAAQTKRIIEKRTSDAHADATTKVYSNKETKDLAKSFEETLIDDKIARTNALKLKKKPLKETIPDELELGKRLKLELGSGKIAHSFEAKEIQNISAAASKIYSTIGDSIKGIDPKASSLERFSSKLTKALGQSTETEGVLPIADLKAILDSHNITLEQLGPLYAAELSEAGAKLGSVGRASGVIKRTYETAYKAAGGKRIELEETLDSLDNATREIGSLTGTARKKLEQEMPDGYGARIGNFWRNLSRASVGLMTIQPATTIRNTTNGYFRNYIYMLDNYGAGMVNLAKGKVQKLTAPSDALIKQEVNRATQTGIAQLKAGNSAFRQEDIFLGITSAETMSLFKLLQDPAFGQSEKISKLVREMGDVADITGAETGLLGAVRRLNVLNTMSDNMFKRAIYSRELDKAIRSQPIKVGEDVIDSLDSVLRTGNLSKVPNDYFARAMEEAFDFTYQTGSFKGRQGGFNSVASVIIEAGQTPLGATFIPFPRYLVNQFRFVYDHTPVLGLINTAGILNKPGRPVSGIAGGAVDLSPDQLGKQLGGLGMLLTFLSLRANYGDENTAWYEYKNPLNPNESFDTRASLGPFSLYALTADILYRQNPGGAIRGKDAKVMNLFVPDNPNLAQDVTKTINMEEVAKALGGGTIRTGATSDLIEGVGNILSNYDKGDDLLSLQETLARYLGGVLSRPLVGAGALKDIQAQLDPEYRQLPSNADVNMWSYMFKQATRSLPFVGKVEEGGREPLASPTRSSGRRKINPILKQISGFTPMQRRTTVEKELARLQLDFRDLSPRRIKGDSPASNEARQIMGNLVEDKVFSYINSEDYLGLESDIQKDANLREVIGTYKAEARKKVLDTTRYEDELDRQARMRRKYINLPKRDKKDIEDRWSRSPKNVTGETIMKLQNWEEGLSMQR